jgi:hypothetical protein
VIWEGRKRRDMYGGGMGRGRGQSREICIRVIWLAKNDLFILELFRLCKYWCSYRYIGVVTGIRVLSSVIRVISLQPRSID